MFAGKRQQHFPSFPCLDPSLELAHCSTPAFLSLPAAYLSSFTTMLPATKAKLHHTVNNGPCLNDRRPAPDALLSTETKNNQKNRKERKKERQSKMTEISDLFIFAFFPSFSVIFSSLFLMEREAGNKPAMVYAWGCLLRRKSPTALNRVTTTAGHTISLLWEGGSTVRQPKQQGERRAHIIGASGCRIASMLSLTM